MTSFALLLLRAVTGGFLAGHGAQKLFGAFGGRGPEGTARNFEKIGIEPARKWAVIAGATELTGGALTALGLLSPAGPVVSIAPMIVAWRKQHGDKPIWVNQGGAELPATNIAIASALALAGPGALSFDRLFGVRMPWWLSCLVIAACPRRRDRTRGRHPRDRGRDPPRGSAAVRRGSRADPDRVIAQIASSS